MITLNKCVLCNGELKAKIIDREFNIDGQTFIVPNVPVIECSECGEQYLNPDASRYIDEQVEKFKAGQIAPGLEVNIREIRTRKGLTQQDVAKKLGFTVARFSEIERNKKVPSIQLALKLADVLECNVNELYKLKPFMVRPTKPFSKV